MKNSVNFPKLWERLRIAAEASGNEGLKAVLLNHEKQKEYICRRLNVVSDADVNRIASASTKSQK